MTLEHKFIEFCLQQVGAPYIWGGKGTHLFDKTKGLVGNPFIGNDYGRPPLLVFDCSGLITYALYKVTGLDKRGLWNADLMRRELPVGNEGKPHLRYYDADTNGLVDHVALAVARIDGKWLVVEAAGGDSTTTSMVESERRNAKVRCGFERRIHVPYITALPV